MKTETVIFDTILPHPDPVNIADLLTDIEAVIKRHVILADHAAAALAVWVLHTYTFEMRDTVAYVAIESPEKRCGKTTLLSVLAAMAAKPLIASNITVGALFRSVHTCMPTLFIDEADTFMAGNSTMRGIINSGNTRRTAYVLRLSAGRKNQVGEHGTRPYPRADSLSQRERAGVRESHSNQYPLPVHNEGAAAESLHHPPESTDSGLKKYSCWCPKVIAMIGEVPDTIADRSIVVKMARKLTTEACAPLSELNTADIKSKCARFALDMAQGIAASPKIRCDGLNDRAADTFDPLFVIARLAGPDWEAKLRAAALSLASTADTENSGAGLIMDIMDIFADTLVEKMFSRDLVTQLREGSVKSQTLKYSSINEYQISRILRHYHVRSAYIRIGKEVSRGYHASDFREALTRYVSHADKEARFNAAKQRLKLQEEARAQAKKELELRQQLMATVQKDRKITDESWAILGQLNEMKETAGTSTMVGRESLEP